MIANALIIMQSLPLLLALAMRTPNVCPVRLGQMCGVHARLMWL